jgi:hypothetical protein
MTLFKYYPIITVLILLLTHTVSAGISDGTVFINEFIASNNTTLQDPDENSEYPDWIELYNATNATINLAGMYLTDEINERTKWRIPEGSEIPANGFLVFYADNDTLQGNNHINLRLNSNEGLIALIETDGMNIIDSVSYCCQETDIAYARYPDGSGTWYFNTDATPNTTNTLGYLGRIADLQFSLERGLYDQPIPVAITSATTDISIHYTLDGSEPGPNISSNVLKYAQPIVINKTTCLRAAAYKQNWKSTDVITQTYIFLEDVIRQPVLPSGFPANWGYKENGDYQMDPDVVKNPSYSGTIKDDLKTLSSLSLVMDVDDWFGQNQGIYLEGELEERAVSAELIFPDQTEGFQINCAVMIVGGTSVDRWKMDKLSMRLKFKNDYGPSTLKYPLFGIDQAQEFNTLVVDARMNNSWAYGGGVTVVGRELTQRDLAQYTRDQFVSDLQNNLGGYAPHGRHIHLYLNGLYWGLYWLHERPDEYFSASYLGGNPEDFDVLKHNSSSVVSGSNQHYLAMMDIANSGLKSNSAYQLIEQYLDISDFINYLLVNFYVGNWDWAHQNWYASRNEKSGDGKWRYHSWDAEHVMEGLNNNVTDKNDEGGPTFLHTKLMENELYCMRFADQVYKHFYNDGIFTPDKIKSIYQMRLDEVDRAVVGESARWGDSHRDIAYTRNAEWVTERDWLLNTFFPQRADIVLDQLRDQGLDLNIDVPRIFVNDMAAVSGFVSRGDILTMENNSGTVYYTENGDDPINFGIVSDINFSTVIPEDADKYVLVPGSNIGNDWRIYTDFDNSGWTICSGSPGGIGYERASGYESYLSLDLGDVMYSGGSNPNTSCYIRIPLTLTDSEFSAIKSLFLEMRCDDGFLAYINGYRVASTNAPASPSWDSAALNATEADSPVKYDLSQYIAKLHSGDNLLAIHGLNASVTSSDFLITAKLIAGDRPASAGTISENAYIYTDPIVISKSMHIKARNYDNNAWSPVNEVHLIVPTYLEGLIVSELHYHPQPETNMDDREFEFIELKNISNRTLDLSAVAFVEGIAYNFPVQTYLEPNQFLVLASNKTQFENRYHILPFDIFSGNFNNGGETITLVDSTADTLITVRYDDSPPWPTLADGGGHSLVIKNSTGISDYNDPDSWRVSYALHGSPGKEDTTANENSGNPNPDYFYLYQNYPNPFNSGTTIAYDIPRDTKVKVSIYNIQGRLVINLVNTAQPRGHYDIHWDGRNKNGTTLASGIYICYIQAKGFFSARKLVLIR